MFSVRLCSLLFVLTLFAIHCSGSTDHNVEWGYCRVYDNDCKMCVSSLSCIYCPSSNRCLLIDNMMPNATMFQIFMDKNKCSVLTTDCVYTDRNALYLMPVFVAFTYLSIWLFCCYCGRYKHAVRMNGYYIFPRNSVQEAQTVVTIGAPNPSPSGLRPTQLSTQGHVNQACDEPQEEDLPPKYDPNM